MEQKEAVEEKKSLGETTDPGEMNPDLKVEIRQYQTLLEILDQPKKAMKVIAAMVTLAMAIFMALAFTTIAIKRFYPYNEIKTNAFGATTMQNEEVELTYWLFNTAELWGNSGIRVERGDQLTIRASGKSNTSIHHLVDRAFYNARPRYRWVGTEGEPRPSNKRTAYRIYGERDPDALIMQVVPERESGDANKLPEEYLRPDFVRSIADEEDPENRFYYIGKERTDLMINQSGTLRFAVNDIVLTDACIDSMVRHNDMIFKENNAEEQYRDLLLLKHDTLMLERLLEQQHPTIYPCLEILPAPDRTKNRMQIKPDPIKIRLALSPRKRLERLAFFTDTSRLWRIGEAIISLSRQCDTLKGFYRYIKDQREPGKKDSTYLRIGNYLMKHPDFMPEIEGKNGPDMARQLFRDSSLRNACADRCKEKYDDRQEKLRSLVYSVEHISEKWCDANSQGMYIGAHPVPLLGSIEGRLHDLSPLALSGKDMQKKIYPFYNEMTYYRENHYYDAWYEDNVGSFLIVVERRKNSVL